MQVKIQEKSKDAFVALSGHFTFVKHAIFKELIEKILNSECEKCTLDLEGIEFADSAALKMLLILKEELQKKGTSLVLSKPSGQIDMLIKMADFGNEFTIEY